MGPSTNEAWSTRVEILRIVHVRRHAHEAVVRDEPPPTGTYAARAAPASARDSGKSGFRSDNTWNAGPESQTEAHSSSAAEPQVHGRECSCPGLESEPGHLIAQVRRQVLDRGDAYEPSLSGSRSDWLMHRSVYGTRKPPGMLPGYNANNAPTPAVSAIANAKRDAECPRQTDAPRRTHAGDQNGETSDVAATTSTMTRSGTRIAVTRGIAAPSATYRPRPVRPAPAGRRGRRDSEPSRACAPPGASSVVGCSPPVSPVRHQARRLRVKSSPTRPTLPPPSSLRQLLALAFQVGSPRVGLRAHRHILAPQPIDIRRQRYPAMTPSDHDIARDARCRNHHQTGR